MTGPVDWDGESYCTATDYCQNPACHRVLTGMVEEHPMYEMVCCYHALMEQS